MKMTDRVYVYMDSRIYGILKKISDKEKTTMSCILRVAFIDKFAKFYPDLFLIQDEKSEDIKNKVEEPKWYLGKEAFEFYEILEKWEGK